MFIIFNKDGSIYAKTQSDFIMQGSNRVNKVYVGFVDNEYENWSCNAVFNLPNGTRTTIPALEVIGGFEYLGVNYKGWEISLTDEVTRYYGIATMTIQVVNSVTSVLYTYLANITINQTGLPIDGYWDASITVAQFNDYMAQLAVKLQANTVSVEVSENDLPEVGEKNVLYFIIGATSNTPYEVKMWNGSEYVPLGTINLSSFASKEQQTAFENDLLDRQADFEEDINAAIAQIRSEVTNPFEVVETTSQLPSTNTGKIYVVLADNKWYYWREGSGYVAGSSFVEAGLTVEDITDYTILNASLYAYIQTRYTNGDHRPFRIDIASVASWTGNENQIEPTGNAFGWYDNTSGDVVIITNSGISALDVDGETRPITNYNSVAERVIYDNSNSGLEATDVQGAIDELEIKNAFVKDIAIDFTNIKGYFYKKDTYINSSGVETELLGYNLYKIPFYESLSLMYFNWDTNDSPFSGIGNTNLLFVIENDDGTLESGNSSTTWRIIDTNSGNACFLNTNQKVIKYVYVLLKDGKEGNISLHYTDREKSKLINEKKYIDLFTLNSNNTFIQTKFYIGRSNGILAYFLDTQDVFSVIVKLKAGDKLSVSNNEPPVSYYGTYIKNDGSYAAITQNNFSFTATEDVILFAFVNENSNLEYIPANRPKILAEDIVGVINESKFNGLSGVAFGTSLTYRSQTTGGYLTKLAELSGITFDNQGVGSSVIYGNDNEYDMLKTIKEYTNYAGKDVAIIEGFVNDFNQARDFGTLYGATETTVCGCLRSAINHIYAQNPNITLIVIFSHYGRTYEGSDFSSTRVNSKGMTQFEFYENLSKVAESMGVKTIKEYKMSEISELTPQYFLDYIHLNSLGAEQSAFAIWTEMSKFYPNK